jgi:ribosomal protein L7/L12
MDPNENLREQREIAKRLLDEDLEGDVDSIMTLSIRLAELVQSLDGWISHQGALPRDWLDEVPIALEAHATDRYNDDYEVYRLILIESGPSRIQVWRLLRSLRSYSLQDLRQITDSLPWVYGSEFSRDTAGELQAMFEGIGAVVRVELVTRTHNPLV